MVNLAAISTIAQRSFPVFQQRAFPNADVVCRSSRSHAVFMLILTMKRHDTDTNLDTEKVSRIKCVLILSISLHV